MNTPKSVAYGWAVSLTCLLQSMSRGVTDKFQALIVATGLGYYYAKGENERRWKDQRARGLRNTDHQDCE